MNITKTLKIISYLLAVIGISLIIALRIIGIDLTEGQLLVNYAPYWFLAIGCLVGSYAIFNNAKT